MMDTYTVVFELLPAIGYEVHHDPRSNAREHLSVTVFIPPEEID